ncbi:Bax inhibitor-1/YccA family protein [Mesonia sp.]|uniref:Bax inhibitor-1/YccA family protein n=1 Tax=Mesonia sp. TaxID=1960830 RepID=UPI00176872C5|nr:Bax inhibitor-1/YccA family protein [Mesonia sp.]HIB36245.1 Bax inhibitor-1/YccA family protein [Mesonia sp.]HIO27692.1 Bax inhibitor-1/YccA family protein [Flavobacteriaceae bacterium]
MNSNFSEASTYEAPSLTQDEIKKAQAGFITKVYSWMTLALVITGLVAIVTASTPSLLNAVLGNKIIFFGLIIGEFALVAYLTTAIKNMSASTAIALFIAYASFNGLTLSFIFLAYTAGSIASTFFVTAATFAAMSAYGYFTKQDLTKIGNLCFMALIGLVIASIVNLFFQNEMLYWIVTYAGVLIFVGLTAWDTQKLKKIAVEGNENSETGQKLSIIGALTLYLDFINLFLFLLRILGNRR